MGYIPYTKMEHGKNIIFQDWLEKESRFLKKWRRRWAVCTSDHLYTFENQDISKSQPTETILLKNCKGVKSAEDDTKRENSFRVDFNGNTFFFVASSPEKKEKWIGVISKQMISPNIINHGHDSDSSDD